MAKPKTHITDPTKTHPRGSLGRCAGSSSWREQVDTADPSCKKCLRAANKRTEVSVTKAR